jgi:hypothetical protein
MLCQDDFAMCFFEMMCKTFGIYEVRGRRSSTPADRGQSQQQQEKRVADSKGGRRRRYEKEKVPTIITLDSHFTSNDNKIAES